MADPQRKYKVGNRPPQDLSPEAREQLDRGHRSKVLDDMVRKAKKAKVNIITTAHDRNSAIKLAKIRREAFTSDINPAPVAKRK